MTHGCLVIEGEGGKVTLHTYHTGMDIPEAVDGAIKVLAVYKAPIVSCVNRGHSVSCVRDMNSYLGFGERLKYTTSAAALIIAAQPGLLEPTTKTNIDRLPRWSGLDSPYRLKITEHKDGGTRWVLKAVDGSVIRDFNATDALIKRISKVASNQVYRNRKAKNNEN